MKKRQWTSVQTPQIVVQGIKGRAVSEIRNEFQPTSYRSTAFCRKSN